MPGVTGPPDRLQHRPRPAGTLPPLLRPGRHHPLRPGGAHRFGLTPRDPAGVRRYPARMPRHSTTSPTDAAARGCEPPGRFGRTALALLLTAAVAVAMHSPAAMGWLLPRIRCSFTEVPTNTIFRRSLR